MKAPTSGGATQGAHLRVAQEAAKALGLAWTGLEEIETEPDPSVMLPEGLDFIWAVFFELCSGRTSGFGLNPLSWTDIKAWSDLHAIRLQPWELDALKRLDAVWLRAMHDGQKDEGAEE